MILMVPLMIETLAKKLEEAAWIPAPLVKAKVFGKQFHTVCSGGAYLNPAYLKCSKIWHYHLARIRHDGVLAGH